MITSRKNNIALFIMVFTAVILPLRVSAQAFNEMTGNMLTTQAGTLEEGKFRIEAYSGISFSNITALDLNGMLDDAINRLGASFLWGMSKNVELGFNLQSFNNIIVGNTINLPGMHLNVKVNLMPKYDFTGAGFGIQLMNFYNGNISWAGDIYALYSTIIKNAVGLDMQLRFLNSLGLTAAIILNPLSSNNLLVEMEYTGGLIIMPGFKMGNANGMQLKLGVLIDTANINLSDMGLNISGGIKF
jgi:hypothetical protein